jgi:[ribosomal protein S5]-alanine N-acetyltransferase
MEARSTVSPPPAELLTLRSPRFLLRPLTIDDAPRMFAGLAEPSGYAFIPDEPPANLEQLRARYAILTRGGSADGSETWMNWLIEGQDQVLHGYLQATVAHADTTIYVAYFVFAAARRQHIAYETLRALLPVLATTYPGYAIEAQIDTRNAASIALVRSLGFECVRHVPHADTFKGSVSDEVHYAWPATHP